MRIIHFSDFHFGNSNSVFNIYELASAIIELLSKNPQETILVISGDVTLRGNKSGYNEAEIFFNKIISAISIHRKNIILCPGNHDIIDGKFVEFDRFSYALTGDDKFTFESSDSVSYVAGNILFKVFNSSYHLDHTYGLINHRSLVNEVIDESGVSTKIAITHHHLLGMFKKDTSAIRNAYDFISYLDKNNFDYLLHGHQHAEQAYYVGQKPIQAISARSGNFEQNGYFNSINIYNFDESSSILTSQTMAFEKSSSGVKLRTIS